jgi:hypothetical protein
MGWGIGVSLTNLSHTHVERPVVNHPFITLHVALQPHLDRSAYRYAGVTLDLVLLNLLPRKNSPWLIALDRSGECVLGSVSPSS